MCCCVSLADFPVYAEIENETKGHKVIELSGNIMQVTLDIIVQLFSSNI